MTKKLLGKKGFTLMECIVALLLFSIITGSVIAVFSASKGQIRTQNEKYKLEVLSENLVSAYAASENFSDFCRLANLNPGIHIEDDGDGMHEETLPLGKGSGVGSIPVAVPYEKIAVDNNTATFVAADGTAVFSFDGGYVRNRLTEGDGGDIPGGTYDRKNTAEMVIGGGIRQALAIFPNNYKITLSKNEITGEKSITFQIQNKASAFVRGMLDDTHDEATWKTATINTLSDFEEYLLDMGYYLKCVNNSNRRVATGSHIEHRGGTIFGYDVEVTDYTTFYDYFFQVYDAMYSGEDQNSATPVTVDGKNLYYCVTFTAEVNGYTLDGSILAGRRTIDNYYCDQAIDAAGNGNMNVEKMSFPLSKATLTYATGNSCPAASAFTQPLNNTNGEAFTGDWHFIPWVFYRSISNSSTHFREAQNSLFCRSYITKNDYYPKTDAYKSIYYIMQRVFDTKAVNTSGDWMFSFNTQDKTDPLTASTCIFENAGISKKVGEEDWQVYYKKGSMPRRQLGKIVFDNNIAAIYDSDNALFIRLIYKNGKFAEDKNSVLSGMFTPYFNISGNTATIKSEYAGDIYFSCDKFDGAYNLTTQSEDNAPVFISNADNFDIIGAEANSEYSFGVVGHQSAGTTVESKTYYITCGLSDIAKKLIVKLTFTNLATSKLTENDTVVEPRMYVWTVDGERITDDSFEGLEALAASSYATREFSYRKG